MDLAAARRTVVRGLGRARSWPWLEILVLIGVELLILGTLSPLNVIKDVLPSNGDNTGHPYAVSMMADSIRHLRLDAWSNGWLSGYPVGVLYPWVGDVVAAILSFVMPLSVAYKLVVVAGVLMLPPSAYLAGRWAGLPRPYPLLFAVFCLPQVFDTSCNVCGGSLNSVLNGEFAYELGIPLGLLALGATTRLLAGRGSRALTAALTALALLAHPTTALWTGVAILITVGAHVARDRRVPVRWLNSGGVAIMLSLAWWIPFLALHGSMPQPLFLKTTQYSFLLFPSNGLWEAVLMLLALIGLYGVLQLRNPFVCGITGVSLLAFLGFFALPQSQLPNLRVLPFWFTGRWLLVAIGLYELASRGYARIQPYLTGSDWSTRMLRRLQPARSLPVVGLVLVAVLQGIPRGVFPGEHFVANPNNAAGNGRQHWLGMNLPGVGQSVVAAATFGGFTADPSSRTAYPQFLETIKKVAAQNGCGLIATDQGGTGEPTFLYFDALQQMPLLTDGCIDNLLGTRGDSSLNFAAALTLLSPLEQQANKAMPLNPYFKYNVAGGVPAAQTLGLKYYLTYDATGDQAAAAAPDLHLVATSNAIHIWEVNDAALVAPLTNQPVTVHLPSGASWQTTFLNQLNADPLSTVLYSPTAPRTGPPSAPAQQPPRRNCPKTPSAT